MRCAYSGQADEHEWIDIACGSKPYPGRSQYPETGCGAYLNIPFGMPRECGIAFLILLAASDINGAVLDVNGGVYMR